MMQNLRLVLIVVGAIAIIALLWHGLWVSRKERSSFFERRSAKRQIQERVDPKDSDEDVGEVRVRAFHEQEKPVIKQYRNNINALYTKSTPPAGQPAYRKRSLSESEYDDNQQAASAKKNRFEELKSVISEDPLTESVRSFPSEEWVGEPRSVAPSHPAASHYRKESALPLETNKKEIRSERVLILHVAAHHGNLIDGALLLQGLHKTGFQFGDMGIFHRHLRPGTKSPVLFSLANMIKPGSFVPDTMSDFSTPGVSIFMVIPSYGDDYKNLELMLHTAQRLADSLNAVILDDEHRLMTPQKLDVYKARIRETLDA